MFFFVYYPNKASKCKSIFLTSRMYIFCNNSASNKNPLNHSGANHLRENNLDYSVSWPMGNEQRISECDQPQVTDGGWYTENCSFISLTILWKYFYSFTPIFVVSTKSIDPSVLKFVVPNTRQQSMRKLYFIGFLFSWFKWTTKSTVIVLVLITDT